jgi:hypothetical protein
MLYLDKLAMLAVLGFALLLAWMTVPPGDLHAQSIKALPLKGSAVLGATYEFKVPTAVRTECASDCNAFGFDVYKQANGTEQRKYFERAMQVAYSAYVTPLHR